MSPVFSSVPGQSSQPAQSPHPHQTPAAVALEVLGGCAALLVIFLLVRMAYSIWRTPRVDRLRLVRSRYQLEAEMAQLQREQLQHRVSELVQGRPPPPYEESLGYLDRAAADAKEGHATTYELKAEDAV